MTITLQRLGTELTRELTCLHKESIGKGPSNTSISIFENTILVKLQDVLSTFESSVSLIPDGEEKIKQMRAQLFAEYSHELLKVIQKYANCALQETVSTVDVRKKEVYLLMIFDRNFEECSRS